jgi:hypothetical protein
MALQQVEEQQRQKAQRRSFNFSNKQHRMSSLMIVGEHD